MTTTVICIILMGIILLKFIDNVGVFLDNSIPYQIRSNLCLTDDVSECIFIEIDKEIFKKDKNIIIGVIYRPPNSDLNAFNTSMSLLLSELIQENKHCYIMGDYNINLLNYENHQPTAEFIDQLHSNSFASLINKPTRVKNIQLLWLTTYSQIPWVIRDSPYKV